MVDEGVVRPAPQMGIHESEYRDDHGEGIPQRRKEETRRDKADNSAEVGDDGDDAGCTSNDVYIERDAKPRHVYVVDDKEKASILVYDKIGERE